MIIKSGIDDANVMRNVNVCLVSRLFEVTKKKSRIVKETIFCSLTANNRRRHSLPYAILSKMGAKCCCCEKKPPIPPEPIPIPRYTQISISTINHLKLINGYLNEPILPLEEALKPFHGKIDQLSDKIKEAKMNCCYPSQHNLTHDESAAIYIYTMKWKSTCLYDHLQAAWNSEDRSQLEPWFKYLKLFKRALDKLPNVKTEVWQGTAFDEKLNEKLSSNSLLLYSSMGSCSPLENDIKDYLHNKQIKKTILLGYDCIDGKLAAGYTANNSKEVIVWPGMKLDVSKCIVTDNNGSLIYHLMGQAGEYYFN
jgi:hypothetical protein